MFQTVHIIPKINSEDREDVRLYVHTIRAAAERAGVTVVQRDGILPGTLIIAVGGDGTMLEAMRQAALHDATAVGVNLGNVGFLTDITVRDPLSTYDFETVIHRILTGAVDTVIEHRAVLTGASSDPNHLSCNEISVAPLGSDTMITYKLMIDKYNAGVHKANSILISTPTGSTAYSLSAGGALMMPALDAFQITPVAPMTMTSRPIIVSPQSVITLEVTGANVAVRSDGQIVAGQPNPALASSPYKLTIRKHLRPTKVLHLAGWDFFNVLTHKLGWNRT